MLFCFDTCSGIPFTTIVGSDGKVHWTGHTASLDAPLTEALAAAVSRNKSKEVSEDRSENKEVVDDEKKSKTE